MDMEKQREERKVPWYIRRAGLFLALLLLGCFVVGGSIAYTAAELFFPGKQDALEAALSLCCLVTVAVGGVGGYLWLIFQSEKS